MEFCALYLFLKNPQTTPFLFLLIRNGTVLLWVIFPCMPKLCNQFWVFKHLARRFLKIFNIFFSFFSLPLFFFFVSCFSQQARLLFLFFPGSSPAQQSWSSRAVAHPKGVRGGASPP